MKSNHARADFIELKNGEDFSARPRAMGRINLQVRLQFALYPTAVRTNIRAFFQPSLQPAKFIALALLPFANIF
jgi:hypothetical protein